MDDPLIRFLANWASNPIQGIATLVVLLWLLHIHRWYRNLAEYEAQVLDRHVRIQVEMLQELEIEKRKNDAPPKAKIGDDGELVFESRHLPYAGDDMAGTAYVFTDESE